MHLSEYISTLEQAPRKISANLMSGMRATANFMLRELKELAPVQSGTFQSGWSLRGPRRVGNQIKFRLANFVPHAVFIEGGVIPGQRPWPVAKGHPRVVNRQFDGESRNWSTKAPGGTVRIMLGGSKYPRVDDAARAILELVDDVM